jgi:hypothetical protein
MTESELLALQVELVGVGWSILQTWLGATFAVVLAAHFAARTFNIYLLVGMLFMYVIFSTAFLIQEINLIERLNLLADDLMALQETGYSLSSNGLYFVDAMRSGAPATANMASIFVGTIGASLYAVYCYRKAKMQKIT